MAFCKINGHRIHYKIIGKDKRRNGLPLIVFLHEGLGSIAQWKDFPSDISRRLGLAALVYDRYGHGKSDMLKEKRTSRFMLHEGSVELPSLLQVLGIDEKLILIGHSDGATIALVYASQFPEKTITVISEAAHVMLEEVSRNSIKNTIILFKETKLRDFLTRYHEGRTESMFYAWAHTWISDEMEGWDMKEELARITSPILAIQGENDEYGSPDQLYWIKKYCSGPVQLLLIPKCGHNPHFQQRELVTKKITEFIHKYVY